MPVPSIKGVVLRPLVRHVNRLIDQGKLDFVEVESRLDDDDLALLENEESIEATLWYPVACQDRLLGLIRDCFGGGEDRVIVEFAREAAAELLESPSYAALVSGAAKMGERAGVALVKISELVFSFSQWSYHGESLADFRVEVDDAEALPETSQWAAAGFIGHLAERVLGRPVAITVERPSVGRVVYHGRAR
ncbi:MAG: hypothetical protein ACQGVK_17560 [Myxococcota bacterium]